MKPRWAIAAVTAALLLAGGCRRPHEGSHARVDVAIAPLIPSSTILIAGLRLDKLKDSPFWREYVEGRKLGALNDLKALTGLDPAMNIWEIVVAWSPGSPVVFIRGKFGGEFGLEPRLEVEGAKRDSYKGFYLLRKQDTGVLFVNSGVAAAGKLDALKAIIDNRDRPGEVPPSDLLALVGTIPGSAQFYAATLDGSAAFGRIAAEYGFPNAGRMARNLGAATFRAELWEGIHAAGGGAYPDEASARQVRDTIRAALGVAQMKGGAAPAKISAEVAGNKVEVELEAPFSLIGELLGAGR